MADLLSKQQLLDVFSGGQPDQIAMRNLIETLYGSYQETSLLIADKVALITDTAKTVVSLALTPGDWDVSGVVAYVPGASTSITFLRQSISATADTDGAAIASRASASAAVVPGATNTPNHDTPVVRLNLTAPATYYLVAHAVFSVSTLSAYGIIRARRIG